MIFFTTFVWTILILRRIQLDMFRNVYCSSCKVAIILLRFWWNFGFLNIFSKNAQVPNFMNIRPVGAELFHADGQTDMTKLMVPFRNFAKVPKMTQGLSQVVECILTDGNRTNDLSLNRSEWGREAKWPKHLLYCWNWVKRNEPWQRRSL
jgi:hypothetical protein